MNYTSFTIKSVISNSCKSQINASRLLINAKQINIFSTIVIIIIGLIGNSLAVFVFVQKRFRIHSSSIYMLCLAISDGMFLLTHFFEDTLRTYIDVYLNAESDIDSACQTNGQILATNTDSLLRLFNITDRFLYSCRIVNYFRYFLRFISAYIIVSFTIHRTIVIYSPFIKRKIESNRIAWITVSSVVIVSGVLNLWVPLFFSLRIKSNGQLGEQYCDIDKEYSKYYFPITIIYVGLILLIPIIILFFCNILVIANIIKAKKKRENMLSEFIMAPIKLKIVRQTTESAISSHLLTPDIRRKELRCLNESSERLSLLSTSLINNNNKKSKNTRTKSTQILLLMSFTFSILNLPYFISWSSFFIRVAFNEQLGLVARFQMFSVLNICEIFYILDYAIHFFIYCVAGKKFRSQLKEAFSVK
jgi:hypothetical protein